MAKPDSPAEEAQETQKAQKEKPSSKVSSLTLSGQILARWAALDAAASYWMSQWQLLATYVMPRKSYILTKVAGPNVDREAQLFDTTAVRANTTMAGGIMAYVNDVGSAWVSLGAPESLEDKEGVSEYYADCSEIILRELSRSNFYTSIHEMHLDRGCFGTCALFVDKGETANLVFRNFNVGSFRISENNEGFIDTIFIKRELTIRQLVEEYGIENVSEKSRRAYDMADGKSLEEKVEIVQAIYPRPEKDRMKGKIDGPNKPVASVHVELGSKKLLRNSGFDEQPFFSSRFLKWEESPYGWSPSWVALPDARQLNFLQKQMDALAELAAFPRLLIPEGMSGEPDLRPGGITYFDSNNPGEKPSEWATQGRYDIGLDRIKQKQQHIEDAFNVPMFQMFAQEESRAQPITATQVRAMESEKLAMLSPTYSLLTTEVLIPLIHRVYGILSRQGLMPEIPQALVQVGPNGIPFVPEPKIIFQNKMSIAVAIQSADAIDPIIAETVATCRQTGDMTPMDNLDMDVIVRKKALARGADADFLRDTKERDAMRQQRAQAQQQQVAMQQQAHAATMAQQLGSVRPDSPAAGAISAGIAGLQGQA